MTFYNFRIASNEVEVSVPFDIYAEVHRIAGTGYHLTLSFDKPLYAKEIKTRKEWVTYQAEEMFKPKVKV